MPHCRVHCVYDRGPGQDRAQLREHVAVPAVERQPRIDHDSIRPVAGPAGERSIAAEDFVLEPRKTELKEGEILTAILIPKQPQTSGADFQRFSLRRGSALAVASVAAWVDVQKGKITAARLVMGAVGPVPLFAERAAALVKGQAPDETLFAEAGRLAAEEARPISDLRGSEQYRREIVCVLTRRALAAAVARAEGGAR